MDPQYLCGLDIGSTTVKVVLLDPQDRSRPRFQRYRRHHADVRKVLHDLLAEAAAELGDVPVRLALTGSAGLGLAERSGLPFVQEVVAAADAALQEVPGVRTLVDIGGEDSKLILFQGQGQIDIRMNGNCAGGTGAFIDQMAALLGVAVEHLNALAERHTSLCSVASRCGVFAKTDVQNLLSQGGSPADVAAAILNAVAVQTVNTLARGSEIRTPVVVSGGPLSYLPFLRSALARVLGIPADDIWVPRAPEVLTAHGAAFAATGEAMALTELTHRLCLHDGTKEGSAENDPPLFADEQAYRTWQAGRFTPLPRCAPSDLKDSLRFLGVDSGSTTTKMVITDAQGRIALTFYQANQGEPLTALAQGLTDLAAALEAAGVEPEVHGVTVTGYGEDLVRAALGCGSGLVETVAHLRAAQAIAPQVSFVLDIGGQDMKALTVERGSLRSVEINEACSSGCGSFLQTFAATLGLGAAELGEQACRAAHPSGLGSRCTVFMGSRVKQALREGTELADIAAGLSYAVIRNCLTKVLKLRSLSMLGDTVVVQGGTFLNPAIHRAFEVLTGARTLCPKEAGHMGAYGCALAARERRATDADPTTGTFRLERGTTEPNPVRKRIPCSGCDNRCQVTRLTFPSGGVFHTGNRCERVFSTGRRAVRRGSNQLAQAEHMTFDRPTRPGGKPAARIGIPRVLNLYEDYPFWCTLLTESGFEVVLSARSSDRTVETSALSVMSDSICFPARLAHGHVAALIEQRVDRILFPNVVYGELAPGAPNSFQCPIVTGYPDVIRSAMAPEARHGVPLDTPVVSFKETRSLRHACWTYLRSLGVSTRRFRRAFRQALAVRGRHAAQQQEQAEHLLAQAAQEDRTVVVLLNRPYHLDPRVHHGVPEMIADLGFDVVMASAVPDAGREHRTNILSQWTYPGRYLNACRYAGPRPRVEAVQLNSFACGPDAVVGDEAADLLRQQGKALTVLRVDENSSPGSLRLRLRTLAEALQLKAGAVLPPVPSRTTPPFLREHQGRTILVPEFGSRFNRFIEHEFNAVGLRMQVLPTADEASLELGLRYVNNEICYPAILVIGDVLKALASGRYDPRSIAVGISQTGGQCRASNYIHLLKKAMISAGHGDIPVVSINLSDGSLHEQPGFKLPVLRLVRAAIPSLIVADVILMLERGARVRLADPELATCLADRLTDDWLAGKGRSCKRVLDMVSRTVEEFRRLPLQEGTYPRIGMVGEIYVKYGTYSNRRVLEWLNGLKVDVVVPPLTGFLLSGLVNILIDREFRLEQGLVKAGMSRGLLAWLETCLARVNRLLAAIPWASPLVGPQQVAERAKQALSLCNQAGEGWLLSGEVLEMASRGIRDVLCLQPFGCIANQVMAKGVERRLTELVPSLRLLTLDCDQNTCEVNMHNRLHFLLRSARQRMTAIEPVREEVRV